MQNDFTRIVNEILEKNSGDKAAASVEMVKRAKKNEFLLNKLLELGADAALRFVFSEGRRIHSNPSFSEGKSITLPSTIRLETRKRFMDQYRLFGGELVLAKAKKEDLAASARKHDAHANGHASAAAFERSVGKRLPSGKNVEQVFDDEKLIQMKAENYKAVVS